MRCGLTFERNRTGLPMHAVCSHFEEVAIMSSSNRYPDILESACGFATNAVLLRLLQLFKILQARLSLARLKASNPAMVGVCGRGAQA